MPALHQSGRQTAAGTSGGAAGFTRTSGQMDTAIAQMQSL